MDGSNGCYVASKWAGETYLESAAAVLGIPVSIYRFTPSPSGIQTHPSVLEELVKFSRMANSLPDPAGWAGNFDLVKAEGIIQRICKSVLGEAKGVTYVHLESEIKMDDTATVEHLHTTVGNELKDKLPALEWVGKIKRLGFEYIWASQNISVGRDEGERLSVVR